ncbi:MAG: polysaccharide deacetylase family protein [Candidatus Rokuibacteriota bacterium]
MTPLGLAAGAAVVTAGAWIGWAGLPHLATVGSVWSGPGDRRRVALTFDDGPDAAWTPRVLDLLGRHGARATFFLVGERAARAPGVVRAIADAGHEVGNHGWSHTSLWRCGPRRTAAEIGRAHHTLGDLAGRAPGHFRPPWGMVNAAMFPLLRRLGERCVFWTIQPEGLTPRPGAAQAGHVLRRARPGAIVDLHDADGVAGAGPRLAEALPPMLDGLRAAGYDLVTVAELIGATREI